MRTATTSRAISRLRPHDFRLLDKTLQRAGGSLKNMVTMTVFITDVRNGDRFVEIRKEMFPDENFPASALITVSGLARPGMLIEIQGIGVIGETARTRSRAPRREQNRSPSPP